MHSIHGKVRCRRWLQFFLPLLIALGVPGAHADEPGLQDFLKGSMETIERRYSDQPFVVALWSITCPPCMHELKMLGRWRQQNPDVPLVLISTDADVEHPQLQALLEDANLAEADNWVYADAHLERLRYEIDPRWHGELPRNYLYTADGERHGISGALKPSLLDDWMNKEAGGAPADTQAEP